MSETQTIEYKQSWHDDYLKWICGFANALGGVLYVGKKDDGEIIHLENYSYLIESIPTKIRDLMGIICDVNLLVENEVHFLEINVLPYSVPVSLRGRYYIRSGTTNLELTGVELNEFLLKKAGKNWDDVVEENASLDDIDETTLTTFISDGNQQGRLPEVKELSTFQLLEKLQLTSTNKLKRAALVLFGKNPSRFYPNIQVKIGRFGKDSADLRFHEIVEGNLIHILKEVPVLLNYKFLTKEIQFEGLQRIEKDLYPKQAIREMLLNALVHRTYMGAPVQMRVFDESLSIWNEGLLPTGITIESLKVDHNSRPRNPIIANACFLAGYIDSWGRGTIKILNACNEHGLPEPTILEKNGGIEVKLSIIKHENLGGAISGAIGGAIGGAITERQLELLQIINENPKISYRELANQLKINNSAVLKHLTILKEKGILERIGGTRGYWKIIINS